jgi:hypothetical protein
VQNRQIDAHRISPAERDLIKETLFEAVLPLSKIESGEANPLLDEQRDFVASIRDGRAPRVCGQHARDALSAAERIIASISRHRWDGTLEGRIGPHMVTSSYVLKGPHWDRHAAASDAPHRKAG